MFSRLMGRSSFSSACLAAVAFSVAALATTPSAFAANDTASSILSQINPSGGTAPSDLFNRKATPPDIASIPVLNNMTKVGAKLHYIGERSGIHGWFIIKDGQIQVVYLSPDKRSAIMGAMFTDNGENVTGPQVESLSTADKSVEALVAESARQEGAVMMAGLAPGGSANVQGAKAPAASTGKNDAPTTLAFPLPPGERLLNDMQAAAGVVLGKSDAPLLFMMVDPNCPHCKSTWRELRESVTSGKLQIKLVPIGYLRPDSPKISAQLLRAADPLSAWDKYAEGDASELAGEPDPTFLQAIRNNQLMSEKWHISGTPYLVYRAKGGSIKIVQGKPDRMPAVLSDLLR